MLSAACGAVFGPASYRTTLLHLLVKGRYECGHIQRFHTQTHEVTCCEKASSQHDANNVNVEDMPLQLKVEAGTCMIYKDQIETQIDLTEGSIENSRGLHAAVPHSCIARNAVAGH